MNLNPDVPPTEITTGVAWYRKEDYPRIREIIRDRDLPPTHAEWLTQAESEERELQSEGKVVARIVADPEEFFSWCMDKRLTPEWTARSEFVLWKLFIDECGSKRA